MSDEFNRIGMEESGNFGMPESIGGVENAAGVGSKELPAKISIWTKFKDFLFQDVEQMELIMTPAEKKFADFWLQDVTIDKTYNFLFKEIKFK